ncbi:Uncharacterised protein [Vibrio cholerae]|nr:Uncharacterised protein [Vibrio cholerae]
MVGCRASENLASGADLHFNRECISLLCGKFSLADRGVSSADRDFAANSVQSCQ